MPQISHAYAFGRVQALKGTLLSKADMDRLSGARSIAQVCRLLSEMGWGEASDRGGIEALSNRHLIEACAFVREASAEPEITDCFLLKYDILNLKILFKARMLGREPDALSECGTLAPEVLKRCVYEGNYLSLPEFIRDAAEGVDERIARDPSPFYVDVELDKLYADIVKGRAAGTKNAELKEYFATWAEVVNLTIALRLYAMGKRADVLGTLLVSGGALGRGDYERVLAEPGIAYERVKHRPYAGALKDALQKPCVREMLLSIETCIDEALFSLIEPCQRDLTNVLPVVFYFLARQREAAAVRTITIAAASRGVCE